MKSREMILALVSFAIAAALLLGSRNLHAIPGQQYGADTLPRVIALLAAAIGVGFLIGAMRAGRGEPATVAEATGTASADAILGLPADHHWARTPQGWLRVGAAIGLIVLYLLLARPLGFVPSALVMVLGMMLLMRVHPVTAVIVSVIAVLALRYAFGNLLLVPLPRSEWLGF